MTSPRSTDSTCRRATHSAGVAIGLAAALTLMACGDGDRISTQARTTLTASSTTTTHGRRATAATPVTSWEAQRRLRYHLVKPPEVSFSRGSEPGSAEYFVSVRFNQRLRRVPKRHRDYPEQGGKEGPTWASMRLNGYGGDFWRGLGTISFDVPCYERNFDQRDDHDYSDPPLFPPYEGKLVVVSIRVPGQSPIELRVRARHRTEAAIKESLRRLGCRGTR